LKHAKDVDAVVAQVRRSFGDRQLVSASAKGSVLAVTLDIPGTPKTPGYGVKGTFEAQVLGTAVADWMTLNTGTTWATPGLAYPLAHG
jgi:hypothetical protein